ncbi:hypothetical protein OU995_03165 [Roseateles sp. SL47]|uniref:hypothetical protein n=1 Tax=Roseateles sp. SL47 TaxID=2995138 RepID=UPI00226E6610|nr:hypothetical protein [Roseateles sp. SL47]WAC73756.1 hypothetical protein OU995_03165 [Roseateles sp. SL47]
MLYRLYCSSGNTVGIDEFLCYSEIEADGHWLRYVEVRADGTALRYDREHAADTFGVLPEGQWDELEASQVEFGTVSAISAGLFEAIWRTTRCVNVS